MWSGSSTTAAATTGPASGPRPAPSHPASGQMPWPSPRRSRRNVGRSTGSLIGRRFDSAALRGMIAPQCAPRSRCPLPRGAGGGWRGNGNLKQTQLLRPRLWRPEVLDAERRFRRIQPDLLAGHLEAAADHPSIRAGALHARAPGRAVILAPPHIADELEDVTVAIRVIRHQPLAAEIAHLERPPQ